mgnify:FL=1
MKYYSDKTKKYYEEDQLDVLKADEEAFDKENQKLEVAKAERAERAKEVEEAYKKAEEARREADKLLNDFVKGYKSFHFTVKSDRIPTPSVSLFDMIFNPLINPFFN